MHNVYLRDSGQKLKPNRNREGNCSSDYLGDFGQKRKPTNRKRERTLPKAEHAQWLPG